MDTCIPRFAPGAKHAQLKQQHRSYMAEKMLLSDFSNQCILILLIICTAFLNLRLCKKWELCCVTSQIT